MNAAFVTALIFFGVALIFIACAPLAKNQDEFRPRHVAVVGIVLALFGVLFTVIASANTVPVRSVGIVTSFNKPTGETTGSGFHWVAPWQKIGEYDASIQTSDHSGDKRCTTARIGSLATACVENKVRWQVKENSAPKLYFDYKTDFNNMRANLFETELQDAINEAFATYNPLANIDLKTGVVKFDLTDMAENLKTSLERRLGNDIIIHSVTIPLIHHDAKTEESIKLFQDVLAQNRVLSQQETNVAIEKRIAAALANLPPAYTVNKCLDYAKELGKEPGYCMMSGGLFNLTK